MFGKPCSKLLHRFLQKTCIHQFRFHSLSDTNIYVIPQDIYWRYIRRHRPVDDGDVVSPPVHRHLDYRVKKLKPLVINISTKSNDELFDVNDQH